MKFSSVEAELVSARTDGSKQETYSGPFERPTETFSRRRGAAASVLGKRTVVETAIVVLLLVWAAFIAWLSIEGVLELLPT